MKTVYANSRHPRLVKWSCVIAFIVGLGLYILYMTLDGFSEQKASPAHFQPHYGQL